MTIRNNPTSAPRPAPRPDETHKTDGAAPAAPAAPASQAAAALPAAPTKAQGAQAALTTFTNAVERVEGGGVKVDLHEAAVAAKELRSARRTSATTATAPPAPPAAAGTPVVNIGGIELRGLDLNSIQEGTFKMSMPMREGTFKMPTSYEDAEISVPRGTKVDVTVKVEKGPDGKPRIVQAELQFNNKLTVLNPASSLKPTSGTFGGAIDTVQDWLGDIHLKGLKIDKSGEIKVDGVVDKPWPLSDSPLQKELSPGTFPKLNMDVQSIVSGNAVARAADDPEIKGKSVGLDQMLKGLGTMTKLGTYAIDLKSGPSRLQADGKGIHLSTDDKPVKVHIEGKVNVGKDGSIGLEIDKNALPEVMTGAGTLDVDGKMKLQVDKKGTMTGSGDVAFRGNIDGVSGKVSPAENVTVPLEIRGADNIIAGKTSIKLNGDKVELKNGSASVDIKTKVAAGTTIDIAGTAVTLKDGKVQTAAGMSFDYDGKNVNVTDGTIKAKVTGSDADVSYNGMKVRVDGKTEIKVEGSQIAMNTATMNPSGQGTLSMSATPKADPTGKLSTMPPLKAEADFKLNPDGTMVLKPGKGGSLTEFIAPFTTIRGNPANMVDPKAPPSGAVGSTAMKDRITELTGSKVRENNKAELLIDGLESQKKRLELINNAKESICLQTLIFQDDKSGMDTANALMEAAKRGVKVRVIVDSLGNVENIKDLTEGKQVYDMMRKAGVDVQLHNDPRQTGLKDLIEEIRKNPKLANIKSASDLTDPAVAMPLFQRLAQLAQDKEAASADTRSKITSALGKMLNGTPGESPTVNANEIARLAMGDTVRMAELLTATKQVADLNHRWHEKYLIADGKSVVMGGMNIADEYLMGGSGAKVDVMGHQKTAWRDTDMFIQGPAASDAYNSFTRNWKTTTGQDMPPPPPPESLAVDSAQGGGTQVQILQHRPREDKDHHIENFMIENIKALKPGEKCYIGNADLLPTGALTSYKQALMDAAKRGVDVRIVTNSAATNDMPQMNQAALPAYREMLASGVRIFERTGDRTMHQKVAVFGGNTVAVGSWNADNRSASLNSEALAIAYGDKMGQQMEAQLSKDMAPDVAREVQLADVGPLPAKQELKNSIISIFSDLM